ncbi:putative quinol monooxygenase [Pseudooceanicola sp. LIPI14-2-Ac024]|uniref:putative quinol monooxygenase n=1 Tax=Pseudooceanicola sp. LIPI14-2-Ac024 TaxID=3344875 RepID=UPI0035D0DEDF
MYAVVVTFTIHPGRMAAFLPAVRANARTALEEEPGCHRFDVLTDADRPDEVLLYELYGDRAAFDAHLATAAFRSFDAGVAPMVAAKDVRCYATVTS